MLRVRLERDPFSGGFFYALAENYGSKTCWKSPQKGASMRCCIVCKSPIDPDRLEVIPETRLCTQHGQEIQDFGGEFIVSASHERTSKQGSLKHNYGGVATSMTRNDEALRKLCDRFEHEQMES
jgi:hypothetical protein